MILVEKTQTYGWEAAIRGMRNPMNSWEQFDSHPCDVTECAAYPLYTRNSACDALGSEDLILGPNDLDLAKRLATAGPDHGKFMRMITVTADLTAPLYWWKEFDTYKVGTVANSCSTMHKIHAKPFIMDDFSHEHLDVRCRKVLSNIIDVLNSYRELYVSYDPNNFEIRGCPPKKMFWWQMIQLLPSSYNQKRTVMLNYAVLKNIYHARRNHKLDEWREFCRWIESLPYSELITE